MFKDIGEKIKFAAKLLCWVGIIGSIIMGIAFGSLGSATKGTEADISGLMSFIGVTITIGGSILSWIGSWLLYSWGDIVNNVQEINYTLNKQAEQNLKTAPQSSKLFRSSQTTSKATSIKWTCPKCSEENNANAQYCINCFTKKP